MVAVALTVGGWFASTVISKLITELIDYAKDQKKMQLGLKDELARLEKALPKIEVVVKVVDQGLIREENPPLEKWLWQLRDVADQADNVMDEMEYDFAKEKAEAGKSKVSKVASNFRAFLQRAVDKDPALKRLKNVVKAIDEVASDVGEFYKLAKNFEKNQKDKVKSGMNGRETSSVLDVETHIFGREKEKEYIINKLLNPERKVGGMKFSVLPIIGQGGVGKTTVAQLVYNDPNVENHFQLRMWVCVSNDFDVVSLTKKLYESTFKKRADFDNFDLIQRKLVEKLESKRFLVVFDDAWNDNDKSGWEKLLAPLKYGDSGSMILLTTRMKAVAEIIGINQIDPVFLRGLSEHDMWSISERCAFGGEDPNYHKELVEIGRDIVKKLKGSPLAAKTIGGILHSNLSEEHWKSVLESELWSLEHGPNDIMPALRLTYQYLPSHLKPCFSFCSIFPQDHVFIKEDLICMWVALGMVPRYVNGSKRPEDVGSKYFDDMLNKSIFVPASQYGLFHDIPCLWHSLNEKPPLGYVMHDLMHDLSTFVSKGECFRTNIEKSEPIPNTVRHLYAHVKNLSTSSTGLKNVRTLILYSDRSYDPDLVAQILEGMKNLRVLTLFARDLNRCPESASNLLHLRYLTLDLDSLRALPKSMSRLHLLETIGIYTFPGESKKTDHVLGKLINLRHVIASEWFVEKIAGVGRLTSLQELSFCVGKESGFKISELRDMRELRTLSINNLWNVGGREEAIQANLRNKVNLCRLNFQCSSQSQYFLGLPRFEETGIDEDVFDHLEPHFGLKELTIIDHMGARPPAWLSAQSRSKLVYLKVENCNWEHLPCLEERPFLKYVEFRDMNALKSIIHANNQTSQVGTFPSLEVLSFIDMPEIKQWYLAGQPNKWMQCLRELTIANCPKLRVLPPIPTSLKKLKVECLGLVALPNLWEDARSMSESSPSLVKMEIIGCKNLISLAEGLLQKPEQFAALEKLTIRDCKSLMDMPQGGFRRFISLKELDIDGCPNIQGQLVQECFLPSSLWKLCITSCSALDITLPKALESVHGLISLELADCANLTKLPPIKVFGRWKTLRKLVITNCPKIASLESLVGLFFIELLIIRKCPKLASTISSPLALKKEETERVRDEVTMQTLDVSENDSLIKVEKRFSACSRRALAFFQVLCSLFFLFLRMFMSKLSRSVSAKPQPQPTPTSSMETKEKPPLSVDELVIDDPLLLSIEPIKCLSAVRILTIQDCSELQSLPELPPFLEDLSLYNCCPELESRCENSGADWPKLSHIPKLSISRYTGWPI